MNTAEVFAVFDDYFSDLNQFILELVKVYEAGKIESWNDLEEKVSAYFTPERMEQMEAIVPGWQRMASYSAGITLVHVMCVFLGLFMLPEFQGLSPEQKQLAKWIVLFHDVAKFHIPGRKDTMHAFRSAIQAAHTLTRFGFPTTKKYHERINSWSEYTLQAFTAGARETAPKPDNQKLPGILTGIEQLYGKNTPATLIIKTILFHISFHEDDAYPTPAPLTENEIKRYISPSLLPLSRVMLLADNEGWTLFDPVERQRFYKATLALFQRVEELIAAERRG